MLVNFFNGVIYANNAKKENDFRVPVYPIYVTLLAYAVNCTMAIVISFFFSFHVGLIRKNMTTIEHMERKRANHTQGAEMTDVRVPE